MSFSTSRLLGESEMKYIYRLGNAKDNGLLDMTWQELAEIFNKELRDSDTKCGESVYRKKYALMKQFYDEFVGENISLDSSSAKDLKELKDEIQKEKKKLFDQRREYNKLLAGDARAEHLTDCMIDAARKLGKKYPLLSTSKKNKDNTTNNQIRETAVLCLSDLHYGMVTDNVWNKYNTDICKKRLERCVDYTKHFLSNHTIKTLSIVLLGDAAHGAIHVSTRVKSEEDTCDQIIEVSELLAQAINDLSDAVEDVHVYSCYGNHLRTVQKKEDSIYTDNMEKIIPWWLKQRLKENSKVKIHNSKFKEFTAFTLFNKYNICCVHGDLFNFKEIGLTANTLFTKLLCIPIDYTISADKHHLEEFSQFGIESILVRSMCGTDDYAAQKHLYDKPGQSLIIFNEKYGRECTYNIPVDVEISEWRQTVDRPEIIDDNDLPF